MKRYLVEYEVESQGIVDGIDARTFRIPIRNATVELRNKNAEPGIEFSTLSAFVIFDADSLESAHDHGDEILIELLDLLAFSTHMTFRLSKKLAVADWTPGLAERECWILKKYTGDESPYPVLNEEISETVQLLLGGDISEQLRRALRWFASAMSSRYMDEQFQCFWFVIEILAQISKSVERVNDLCPVCKQPLHCTTCNNLPTHRPYPKQSIADLFSKIVRGDDGKAFEFSNEVRNRLMHGQNVDSIERDLGVEFSKHIDVVGKVAWSALLKELRESMAQQNLEGRKLNIVQANTFCDYDMHVHVHVTFRSRNPDAPDVTEIPNVNVN